MTSPLALTLPTMISSKRVLSLPYVCASCTRGITGQITHATRDNGAAQLRSYSNIHSRPARSSKHITKPNSPFLPALRKAYSTAIPPHKPLRLAIIGSGPAGFYTAHRLLHKVQDAVIDMYEQLPVPYGLVRFGVAPDHPEVKNCQDTFEEVAKSPRFNYIGNVRVGHDIELAKLKPHYDAILFSYGADEDRRLGIPGEDLEGVF